MISLPIDSKLANRWICKCWRLRSFFNLKLSLHLVWICHLKFGESSFNNKVSLSTPKRKGFIFSWLRNNVHWGIFCNNKLIYLSWLEGDFQRCANKFFLSIKIRINNRFYINSIGVFFRKPVGLKTHDHFLRAVTSRCKIKG